MGTQASDLSAQVTLDNNCAIYQSALPVTIVDTTAFICFLNSWGDYADILLASQTLIGFLD